MQNNLKIASQAIVDTQNSSPQSVGALRITARLINVSTTMTISTSPLCDMCGEVEYNISVSVPSLYYDENEILRVYLQITFSVNLIHKIVHNRPSREIGTEFVPSPHSIWLSICSAYELFYVR